MSQAGEVGGGGTTQTFRDEDQFHRLDLDEDTLGRLKRNDPSVASLQIHSENWIKGASRIFGDSIFLKYVVIEFEAEPSQRPWLDELFTGISRNRTIESLSLKGRWDYIESSRPELNTLPILAPFFEHNHKLLNIEFENITMLHTPTYLGLALEKCSQLNRIRLCDIKVTDKQMAMIISSLQGKHCLLELDIIGNNANGDNCVVGEQSCREISKLLESPACNIQSLALQMDYEFDDCINFLFKGLMANNTVKTLYLGNLHIAYLGNYHIGHGNIWRNSSHAMSEVLSRPMSSLETLDLEGSILNNDDLTYLTDSFVNNKTLKKLGLSNFDEENEITIAGWRHLFKCMEHDNFSLEELTITCCHIIDDWVSSMAKSLSTNTSLKKLDMRFNNVTMAGWIIFFGVLLNKTSCCSLEMINMRGTDENEIENGQLDDLENILSRALCSTLSVDCNYSSNHTLHTIMMSQNWSQEMMSLLELNRNKDKAEVAHLKSLRYFFSSGRDSDTANQMFASLPDAMLPSALEWIGRGNNRDGFSLMYSVVHDFPTLVEIRNADHDAPSSSGMKKRKALI